MRERTRPLPLSANSGHQLSALGCPLIRHSLSEVCPALTASTTVRMAWMTTGALSTMMKCPECVSVMCTAPGTSAASLFWVADHARSMTTPKSGGVSGRQVTGLDALRDEIDILVAGREHDDRHGL